MNNLSEELITLNEDNDFFGTYNKAKTMIEFLELDENRTILAKNNMISLYGEWGCGKSSILKTIKEKINKKKFKVVWFDTWKYEKDDNILYSLLKYIITNGDENYGNKTNIVLSALSSILVDAKVQLPFMEMNADPQKVKERYKEEMNNNKCYWEKTIEFEKEFNKIKPSDNKRILVILDDLDRCESENIIALLGSIKQLLSINTNIIFLFGIDRNAVTLALQNKYGNDYNKANEYLEKIFPISFELNTNNKNDNFINYISEITDLKVEESKFIITVLDTLKIRNPRHIKKVLRKYYFIKKYLKSKNIDVENKYTVAIVINMITLNLFYERNYRKFFEDKSVIYNDYKVYGKSSKDNSINEYSFNINNIACHYINTNETIDKDIFQLLIEFTNADCLSKSLRVYHYSGDKYETSYYEWKKMFDDGINFDFLDLIIKDESFLNYFYQEKDFNNLKIRNLLNIVDCLL